MDGVLRILTKEVPKAPKMCPINLTLYFQNDFLNRNNSDTLI